MIQSVVLGRGRATESRTWASTSPSPRQLPLPASCFRMQDSGCRVQGSGFREQGLRFRVQGRCCCCWHQGGEARTSASISRPSPRQVFRGYSKLKTHTTIGSYDRSTYTQEHRTFLGAVCVVKIDKSL